MKTRYAHIHFVEVAKKTKTSVWSCRNNRSKEELGQVKWYGPWRQYCYFPTRQAVYNNRCLSIIADFTGTLTTFHDEFLDKNQ